MSPKSWSLRLPVSRKLKLLHLGHWSGRTAARPAAASKASTRLRIASSSSGAEVMRFQAGHLFSKDNMLSRVLKTFSLPDVGAAHCTPQGVRLWRPCFQALQVSHTHDGHVVLTCISVHGEAFLFSLAKPELEHLVRLLTTPPPEGGASIATGVDGAATEGAAVGGGEAEPRAAAQHQAKGAA